MVTGERPAAPETSFPPHLFPRRRHPSRGAGHHVFWSLVLLLLVSGAGGPAEPEAPPVVVRLNTGPYSSRTAEETAPWVVALEQARVERVAAENAADFSSYRLRRTWPEDEVRRMIEDTRRALRDGTAQVHVGPMPFFPLDVEVTDGGRRAVVRGCAARPDTLQERLTLDTHEWPTPATFTLELFPDGFRRVVDSTVGPLSEPFTLPEEGYFSESLDLTPQTCGWIREIPAVAVLPVPDLYELMAKEPEDVVVPIVTTWGDGQPSPPTDGGTASDRG